MAATIGGAAAVIAVAVVLITQLAGFGNGPQVASAPQPGAGGSAQPSQSGKTATSASSPATPNGTPGPDFTASADKVKSGVLRVFATGCGDGTRIGSAFLIGKKTAVTSYADVAGAKAIVLTNGDKTVPVTVRTADPDHGVVILHLGDAVDGHVFDLAKTPLEQGDPIAVLGDALHETAPRATTGEISATDQTVTVAGTSISGLAGAGIDYDGGWAGAPALDTDGRARGMVVAGPEQTSIVPASAIKAALKGHWDLPASTCTQTLGPEETQIGGHPTEAVEQLLSRYFGAINAGDYVTAYAQLGPGSKPAGTTREEYFQGWSSSYDFNITVHANDRGGAHVSFDSIFEPGQGPAPSITCARWDIDYEFTDDNGQMLINKSQAHSGRIWHRC